MIWSLLIGDNKTACPVPVKLKWSDGTSTIFIKTYVTPNSHDAGESAQESTKQIYSILRKEGYLTKSVLARYELVDAPANIIGKSAGLAFALAFLTKAFPRRTFKPMAATGVIQENGIISRVEGFSEKINAALDTLPEGSQVYFPEENTNELNPNTIEQATERKIELVTVNRLEEVLARLGIKLDKIYSYSPYRGLESFGFEHSGIFFGRSREIEAVSEQLNNRAQSGKPSLIVIGGSGSGKSSLVFAGVLPELIRRDGWPSSVQGRYGQFRPRDVNLGPSDMESLIDSDELDALYKAVFASWVQGLGLSKETEIPENTEETRSEALITWLHQANKKLHKQPNIDTSRFVWVVDQLEELFTFGFNAETIRQFCGLLAAVAKDDVYLIVTLRNDYYDQYQNQTALIEHFRDQGQYNLTLIGHEAIDQIIREPAQMADCTFETDRDKGNLADRIQRDAGGQSSVLPLLEFTLSELFERREKAERRLTHSAYEAIDGLEGCIGHRAEAVYQALDEESQQALPGLIRRLCIVETHQDKPVAARAIDLDIYSAQSPKRKVIDCMTEARLFIKEQIEESRTQVRVAHEALLTKWERARRQIAREGRDLELMRRLEEQSQLWRGSDKANRSSLLLNAGLPLTEAVDLLDRLGDDLPGFVRDFIKQSQQFEELRISEEDRLRKQRLYRFLAGLSVLSIVVVIALTMAWWAYQAQKAENIANQAAEREMKLNAQKQALVKNQDIYLQELKLEEEMYGLHNKRLITTLEKLRLNYIEQGLDNDAELIEKRMDSIESVERKELLKKQEKLSKKQEDWLKQEKGYLKQLELYEQSFGLNDKRLVPWLQQLEMVYRRQGRHKDKARIRNRKQNIIRQK